jgi:hypothetical protein
MRRGQRLSLQLTASNFNSSLRLIAALWIAASLSGCANSLQQDQVTLVKDQHPKDALAVRFEEVRFGHVPMTTALLALSNAIYNSPKLPHFQWEAPYSYDAQKTPHLRDPKVSLLAHDVSLEVVLDRLCSQAGWSYHKTAKGIELDTGGH